MARTALVTGGSGYIASHLVPALVADGWEVRACGRRERPAHLPADAAYRRVELAEGPGLQELLDGITHVFHLAGASSSRSSEEEMWRSNVVATGRVVAAAAAAGVERFVHVSSTSVYGEEDQLPVPVPEEVEPHPSRAYGKAKWGAEQAVWRAVGQVPAVVLRPVTVFGPGNEKLLASAILDAAIERFAGLPALAVHDVPVEQRLVHVDDVVAACLHLATADGAVGRAFNVCLDRYPTSHEVARMLGDELGLAVELSDDPDCGPGPDARAALHARMVSEGMEPRILLTPERFRFMRKGNRNNRLSIDALLGTGFRFACDDLRASVGATVEWYRRHRWIL